MGDSMKDRVDLLHNNVKSALVQWDEMDLSLDTFLRETAAIDADSEEQILFGRHAGDMTYDMLNDIDRQVRLMSSESLAAHERLIEASAHLSKLDEHLTELHRMQGALKTMLENRGLNNVDA